MCRGAVARALVALVAVGCGVVAEGRAGDSRPPESRAALVERALALTYVPWPETTYPPGPARRSAAAAKEFSHLLVRIASGMDADARTKALANEARSIQDKLVAIAVYLDEAPLAYDEITQQYLYTVSRTPAGGPPRLFGEHTSERFRLVWEFWLLSPSPSVGLGYWNRAAQALGTRADPRSCITILHAMRAGMAGARVPTLEGCHNCRMGLSALMAMRSVEALETVDAAFPVPPQPDVAASARRTAAVRFLAQYGDSWWQPGRWQALLLTMDGSGRAELQRLAREIWREIATGYRDFGPLDGRNPTSLKPDELRAREGDEPWVKHALIHQHYREHPELFAEIAERYVRYRWEEPPGTEAPPLDAAHAAAPYRLVWEFYLGEPSISATAPEYERRALEAVIRIGDERSGSTLGRVMLHRCKAGTPVGSCETCRAAITALAGMPTPGAVRAVAECLQEPYSPTSPEAARRLEAFRYLADRIAEVPAERQRAWRAHLEALGTSSEPNAAAVRALARDLLPLLRRP